MNGPLLEWIDECLRLEEENRELRDLLAVILLVVRNGDELSSFARHEIERRFGEAA